MARWLTILLLVTGCGGAAPVVIDAPTGKAARTLPGVDSVFVALAERYAVRAGPDAVHRARAEQARTGGQALLALADSLLIRYAPPADTANVTTDDQAAAVEHFNEGARVLQADTPGAEELRQAAEQFRLALEADPYDTEAHYWLSRVYELQYRRLGEAGAVDEAISVLDRLVEMHPHRHDYTALLAAAYEASGSPAHWRAAGGLWSRAGQLLEEDALLALDTTTVMDTARAFVYWVNASRAFIEADDAAMAIAALQEAARWAQDAADRTYLAAEEEWLTWDENLANRKRYDRLLELARRDADAGVRGLEALLTQVTRRQARWEVSHQLALTLYNRGSIEAGITRLQALWEEVARVETPLRDRVREDYGVMAYSTGQRRREAGDLRSSVAYLLQSEATGFSQAAAAALTLAHVLRNDPVASLDAAQRAETGWDHLSYDDRRALLQLMVENHRRLGNRDEAARYATRYRRLPRDG